MTAEPMLASGMNARLVTKLGCGKSLAVAEGETLASALGVAL
jgi:hypothetical protein